MISKQLIDDAIESELKHIHVAKKWRELIYKQIRDILHSYHGSYNISVSTTSSGDYCQTFVSQGGCGRFYIGLQPGKIVINDYLNEMVFHNSTSESELAHAIVPLMVKVVGGSND